MTMRLKPTYQNHFKDWIKGLIGVYGIIVLLYIMALILKLTRPDILGNFGGLESLTQTFILIMGIYLFKPNLKLALANGISRKTEFTVALLTASTVAVAVTLLNYVMGCLFSTITHYYSMFELNFGNVNFSNNFIRYTIGFASDVLSYFTNFVLGYFIGALYYRMSKPLKISVSVGVPVLCFIGLPVLYSLFGKSSFIVRIIDNVINLLKTIASSPYYTVIFDIVIIIAFGIFSFLLIKRAPIKEQG